MHKELMTLISRASKEGFIKAGDITCGTALSSGKTEVIIVAKNASNTIKTKFGQLGYKYDVEVVTFGDKNELSWLTGKNDTEVMAIIDKETADSIRKLVEDIAENE